MADRKKRSKRKRAKAKRKPNRYRVSDGLWEKFEPLIPVRVNSHPRGGGRKPRPDREVVDGIFFVLRTGCQWKALDETSICSGSVAHARFQKWVEAGVFLRFWQEGLREYDECKGIDWNWQSMDGAMTKAPLGGEKNGPQSDGQGQRWRQTKLAV
jgi:putative transposase